MVRKFLLLALIVFTALVSLNLQGQVAVVSSYLNAGDPRDEWSEIVIVSDDHSLYNSTYRDNNSTQTAWQTAITFSNAAYWTGLRSGTVILLWHRSVASTGVPRTPDINKNDGYIEVMANDIAYFTGGDFGSPPLYNGNSLNVAGNGDLLQLRNGGSANIQALGHIATPGSTFGPIVGPKLNHTQTLSSNEAVFVCPGSNLSEYGTLPPQSGTTWTAKAASPNVTRGLPNQCTASSTANSDYWRSLRQPAWTSPTLTATYTAPNIDLSWNAATDPVPADGTQGYMIVRNTANTFNAPNDGYTYSVGETIGTASVIAIIPSSQTLTYTDTYTINCGDTLFYQVYAYRFGTDDLNGNNYNPARGRAYNETNFATASVGVPDAPVIASVDHTDATCGEDNGIITINATGVTGVTIEYMIDGYPWQTGNTFTNLPPGSYNVYVRYVSFNQCQVAFTGNPVVIGDLASPTIIQVDHLDASCGNNNGSITITISGGTPPMEYSIDNGNTWQSSNTFLNLAPGFYDVVVEDANDCEVEYINNPVEISMIAPAIDPTAATVDRNDLCSDDAGNIVLTVVGGGGETAQWFTGSCGGTSVGSGITLTLASPTVTTTYFVYWTSTLCGNSNCASVTVNVTDPPTDSDAGDPQTLCGELSTILDGNQPISGTGLWTQVAPVTPVAVFTDPTLYNTLVTAPSCAVFTFRWTISTGTACPVSESDVVISFSDAVTVIANSNSPVCTGNDIFLTSSIDNAIYSWTGPNGFSSTEQNPVINNAAMVNEGTYTVTVSNIPGGCPNTSADTFVDIVESPVAPASATADPAQVCQGSTEDVMLTATGGSGTTLTWFTESCGGTVIGTGNGLIIQAPAVTTTYYASWATDACGNSGCTTTIVTVLDPPSAAEAGDPITVCGADTTHMAANIPGNGTGTWSFVSGPGTATFDFPNEWNSKVTVTTLGNYIFRWTISNGTVCPESFDEVSVNFGDAIQVMAFSNSPVCTGQDINLTSSIAGATYSWTGPNGFTSNEQNPAINNVDMAAAGTYTVLVTGIPGGCPDTQNSTDVVINQSPAEPASVTSSLGTICADYIGDMTLTASGGVGNTLEWYTGSCGGTLIGTGTSLTIPAPGVTTTYYALWTSTDCGNSTCKSVTVTVEEPPTPSNAGPPQSICNNTSTTMQANTPVIGSGQWSLLMPAPGTISYTPDAFTPGCLISASNIGVYYLVWTISSGGVCPPSSDTVMVEFGNQIIVSVVSNSPVCEGDTIKLNSSIGLATYSWTGPNGFSSNLQNPVIVGATAANAGEYTITVSDIPGDCPETSNSTEVIVGVIPAIPSVNSQNISGTTQDVCASSTVTYSIASPVTGSDYTWSVTGGGNIQSSGTPDIIDINWFAPSGTFDLTVTETNSAGCTGEPYLLTINIIPNTFPSVSISADNVSVCPDTPVQFTAAPADAGSSPAYRWIINGADAGVSTPEFLLDSPADNDLVTCEVTSSDLCAAPATVTSNTIELTVFAAPVVNIPAEDPICAGTPTLLDPGAGYSSYLWNDGSTSSTITVQDEGIYWVMVTDNNGCAGSDTVLVEPCEVMPEMYAPNAFTPNGDSRNDRFFMVCSSPESLTGFEMIIYNRWGQQIFSSKDIGEGWDGTIDGKPCQGDVFPYIVNYRYDVDGGGSKQITGTVTLVR